MGLRNFRQCTINGKLQECGLPILMSGHQRLENTTNKLCGPSSLRCLHVGYRANAGHSKWQNIKHIKAANDKERGMKSNLLVQKVQQVLRECYCLLWCENVDFFFNLINLF